MADEKNPSAFPYSLTYGKAPHFKVRSSTGMTLRDYFAGQALANPEICNGKATDTELSAWFGKNRVVHKSEIVDAQAELYAEEMLRIRNRSQEGGE